MNRLRDKVPWGSGSHHDSRSDETKEGEARRERANDHTHPIPSETEDGHDLEREPEGGKEHAQIVTPFEKSNGGYRGVETTDVDYTRVAFHHGAFALVWVVLVLTAQGVVRVCAVEVEFELESGFVDRVAD